MDLGSLSGIAAFLLCSQINIYLNILLYIFHGYKPVHEVQNQVPNHLLRHRINRIKNAVNSDSGFSVRAMLEEIGTLLK